MSPAEIAVILLAVVAGALVKAITGMGFPLVAIPVISLFVSVETAVVVIALPNITANGLLAWRERHAWPDTRNLPVLIGTSIIGAVAGTFLLVNLPERALTLTLAVAVLFYIATRVRRPDLMIDRTVATRMAPGVGLVAGVFQGAIGVSGPIVAPWIQSYRLVREAFVLSVTSLFLFSGAAQLVILAADGQYDRGRALATLAALVPAVGLIPVGTRLRDRLSTDGFDRAVLALLAVSAIALLIRSA
ncbi:MAG: sulfite exporter TauE/SafE family protein [Acidimicrobiia bacterium]|nr:sulfite exporter TauE/SafE family protein [Acidimicrobiia bacterium]